MSWFPPTGVDYTHVVETRCCENRCCRWNNNRKLSKLIWNHKNFQHESVEIYKNRLGVNPFLSLLDTTAHNNSYFVHILTHSVRHTIARTTQPIPPCSLPAASHEALYVAQKVRDTVENNSRENTRAVCIYFSSLISRRLLTAQVAHIGSKNTETDSDLRNFIKTALLQKKPNIQKAVYTFVSYITTRIKHFLIYSNITPRS